MKEQSETLQNLLEESLSKCDALQDKIDEKDTKIKKIKKIS